MMYRKSWKSIPLFLTVSLLAACAAKPRVDIYIEPVVDEREHRSMSEPEH